MAEITNLKMGIVKSYALFVSLVTDDVKQWQREHPAEENIDVVIVIDGQRREMSIDELKQLLFP